MKKILFLTATLALFLAFSANAQQRGPRAPREKATPEQQATRLVERMTQELKLTEQQQKDLKIWYTASFTQRNEIMQKNREDHQKLRQEMQKQREATEAQLKKVLTDAQYKAYQENEAKKRQERQQHKGRPEGQFRDRQQ